MGIESHEDKEKREAMEEAIRVMDEYLENSPDEKTPDYSEEPSWREKLEQFFREGAGALPAMTVVGSVIWLGYLWEHGLHPLFWESVAGMAISSALLCIPARTRQFGKAALGLMGCAAFFIILFFGLG